MQHGRLIQARQLGHVFHLVELGRIHLLDVVPEDHHPFARLGQFHFHLVAILAFDAGRHETLQRYSKETLVNAVHHNVEGAAHSNVQVQCLADNLTATSRFTFVTYAKIISYF